jgi:flagellar biosynthetic protein FliR
VPGADGLIALAFAFMLVLCRCGAAVMLLPGLGESDPPAVLRVGLALALALLLVPVVAPSMPPEPASFLRLAGMVAAELLAGGVLGWLARLLALGLPIAGQIISLMTGLSSVLQQDPTLGVQSAVIGRLFNVLAPVLILSTGLYALPLAALAGSYGVFPAGGVLGSGDLSEVAVRAVSGSFALALRLAAPFVLMSLVWQMALALLARLVPQIQVYFTALPGQVLGGMLLLALLAAPILQAWTGAVRDGFAALPGLAN